MSTRMKSSTVLLILFVLFILYSTTLPFDLTTQAHVLRWNFRSIRWIPMVRPSGARESIPDVVSNVLLFIPLGILIGLVISQRRKHSSWPYIFGLTLLGSALLSGLVETLQLFSVSRITSVTDLLTNSLGGLVGASLLVFFQRMLRSPRLQWGEQGVRLSPDLLLLAAYFAVLFLSSTIPFDISLDIDHIKTGLKAVRLDPFSDPTPPFKMLGNALWLAGLSFLLCYALSRRKPFTQRRGGRLLAVLTALAGTVVYAALLELLQIFIGSRVATTRDVLAGLAGAVYGALWFVLLNPSIPAVGRRPTVSSAEPSQYARLFWLFAIHYLLFLIHGALYPYAFSWPQNLTRSVSAALVPFASYYGKTNALSLFDFLGGILRFAPLGFILQGRVRGQQSSRKWFAVLVCLLTGLLLEGMQLFVVGRYADSSDIIAAGCGGYVGWRVWEWWWDVRTAVEKRPQANRP